MKSVPFETLLLFDCCKCVLIPICFWTPVSSVLTWLFTWPKINRVLQIVWIPEQIYCTKYNTLSLPPPSLCHCTKKSHCRHFIQIFLHFYIYYFRTLEKLCFDYARIPYTGLWGCLTSPFSMDTVEGGGKEKKSASQSRARLPTLV